VTHDIYRRDFSAQLNSSKPLATKLGRNKAASLQSFPLGRLGARITMPFTPFHLGPGAVFKSIGGDHFSLLVFGGSQVLIDLEPAYRMYVGDPILHGVTHTILGALAIGVAATLIGKPISECFLRFLSVTNARMSWTAAISGAFLGTFSHVILDAIMHADMMPWAPITTGNKLLFRLSVSQLHLLCIALGITGMVLIFISQRRKQSP